MWQKENELAFMSESLMHYTSLDVVIRILETGIFKFSSPKNSNDLLESQLHLTHNEYDKIKYACFSKSNKESIPMWKIYSCRKDKGDAILKLNFQNNSNMKHLFLNKK